MKTWGKREELIELKDRSGLTINELGRVLGVTRRTVLALIAGAPISPTHATRIDSLLEHVETYSTPDEARKELFDSSDGVSVFQKLAKERDHAVIHPAPYSPRDVMGVVDKTLIL